MFNAGAQLQLPAQFPQTGGDIGNGLGRVPAAPSGPLDVVKNPPLFRQGVDLRLKGVMLHGQLIRCLDAVLHQIGKLPLVSVKPPDFVPQ